MKKNTPQYATVSGLTTLINDVALTMVLLKNEVDDLNQYIQLLQEQKIKKNQRGAKRKKK